MSSLLIQSNAITNNGNNLSFPTSSGTMTINSNGISADNGNVSLTTPSGINTNSTTISTNSGIQLFPSANLVQTVGVTISGSILGILSGAPQNVSATGANGTASVSFSAPSNNGGSSIVSYVAYAYLNGTGNAVANVTSVSSPISFSGLASGSSYTFKVSAINGTGEGPLSAASNSIIAAILPGAPTIGSLTAGNTTVNVTWSAPSSNGGSPLTSYTVYVNNVATITNINPANTSQLVSGLSNGTSYSFKVTATNVIGEGPASSSSNATPYTTPGAPTIGTVTPGNTAVVVNWTTPANNGGSTIDYYNVYAYYYPSLSFVTVRSPVSSSPYNFTGLVNGTAYVFAVSAHNAAGSGPQSSNSTNVTPATVPSAPTIGVASAGNSSAIVNWSAPSSNGGSAITSYKIYANGSLAVSGISASAVSYSVSGLSNGTAYTFTVSAVNDVGEGAQSSSSNSVTPSTLLASIDPMSTTTYPSQSASVASGTTLYDIVGTNNGIVGANALAYTSSNGSMFINGDSAISFLNTEPAWSLNNSSKSFVIWVNVQNLQTFAFSPSIMSRFTSSSDGYWLSCGASGSSAPVNNFNLRLRSTTDTTDSIISANFGSNVKNTWHMLTAVFANIGTSNTIMSLYVDGGSVNASSGTLNTSSYNDSANITAIASYSTPNTAATQLTGSVGFIQSYSGAMSPADVQSLWTSTRTRFGV